jgi:hypothetical protein
VRRSRAVAAGGGEAVAGGVVVAGIAGTGMAVEETAGGDRDLVLEEWQQTALYPEKSKVQPADRSCIYFTGPVSEPEKKTPLVDGASR